MNAKNALFKPLAIDEKNILHWEILLMPNKYVFIVYNFIYMYLLFVYYANHLVLEIRMQKVYSRLQLIFLQNIHSSLQSSTSWPKFIIPMLTKREMFVLVLLALIIGNQQLVPNKVCFPLMYSTY